MLDSSIFPSMLRFTFITSILKCSYLVVVLNYQPISIQSYISKIFEYLILNAIHLSINIIHMEERHGFRPRRYSTTSNLVSNNYFYDSFQNRSRGYDLYTLQ